MASKTNDYTLSESIGVDTHHEEKPDLLAPDLQMMMLTWIAFFILLGILYKFAWKPILDSLEAREESIRKSVETAERIEVQMQQLEQTKTEILQKAEQSAQLIIKEARDAAKQTARNIQHQAREDARIIMENAQRDLSEEFSKANALLREQSAELSVRLASKLIEKNLDDKANKKLIETYIKDWTA